MKKKKKNFFFSKEAVKIGNYERQEIIDNNGEVAAEHCG
jgi:hypothetical protein